MREPIGRIRWFHVFLILIPRHFIVCWVLLECVTLFQEIMLLTFLENNMFSMLFKNSRLLLEFGVSYRNLWGSLLWRFTRNVWEIFRNPGSKLRNVGGISFFHRYFLLRIFMGIVSNGISYLLWASRIFYAIFDIIVLIHESWDLLLGPSSHLQLTWGCCWCLVNIAWSLQKGIPVLIKSSSMAFSERSHWRVFGFIIYR